MIDESLLKSNFVGRDGFRWWVGQIPPKEAHSKQFDKEGWGNRIKVRIMGYHPPDSEELPNEDLPWAQILLSTSDGTGASNYGTNHKIRPGDVVFGFFLDGDNAQIPVIMGAFGRTSQVSQKEYSSPFVPFTGYTNNIANDGSKLKADQSNEQTQKSQESPYYLPPSIANRNNQISYSGAIGDTVFLATNQPGSKLSKIETELQNAVKFLNDIKSYPNIASQWIDEQVEKLCDQLSQKIEGITNDIVNGIVNDTYEKIIPKLKEGSEKLYDQVSNQVQASTQSVSTGHLAGVRAQAATIEPVKQFQKLLPCLVAEIMKSLASLIKDMVCALLTNVANVVKCVIDQFLGGLLNAIIDLVISGLSAVLGVLSILLSFSGFNLADSIRQSAQGMAGIPFSLNCGEEQKAEDVQKWKIGSGPQQSSSFDLNKILSLANDASAIASSASGVTSGLESTIGSFGFLSPDISVPNLNGALNACYGGPPINALPPTINIFGGGGSGAAAVPIVNNGRLIAALLTSSGSDYTYPPFVSISDNTDAGYGAIGRSIIKNGQVVGIVMDSEGEGYIRGNNPNITISSVVIENPGSNYQKTDKVIDNLGNEYDLVIDNGSITRITPINIKDITDRPIIKVVSDTGSGAKLTPVIGPKKEFQGEVQQVIDCITT